MDNNSNSGSSSWPEPRRGGRHLHGRRELGPRARHLRHRGLRGQGRHRGGQRGRERRVQHHPGGGRVLPLSHPRHPAELVQCLQVREKEGYICIMQFIVKSLGHSLSFFSIVSPKVFIKPVVFELSLLMFVCLSFHLLPYNGEFPKVSPAKGPLLPNPRNQLGLPKKKGLASDVEMNNKNTTI